MDSSDSLKLDENLARFLAAYDQEIDGGDPEALTVNVPVPLPGAEPPIDERQVTPLHIPTANEGSLGELLPDSRNSHASGRFAMPALGLTPAPGGPHRIGRFELRRQLGKGGCGIVFLAYDPKLQREVALKLPRPEMLLNADAKRRLIREGLAAAEFDHPNLVPVYETGEIGPVCFIATAFCPGMTLAEWLDRQAFPVPVRQAARLIATVAEAVQHAHDRGVLHRDLKPNNVILQELKLDEADEPPPGSVQLRGEHLIPRLVDFGLAKLAERGGPSETATRQILGTPKYMAPEQAQARREDIGPPADVYALGVILYEMIAGRAPYDGASDVEVLRQSVEGKPIAPRALRPDVPRDLEAICLKAMAKTTTERYRTAIDFADDLRRFLDERPTVARPLAWSGRASRWLRRNDQLVAIAVLAVIVVFVTALGMLTWLQSRQKLEQVQDKIRDDQATRVRFDRERDYPRQMRDAFLAWRSGNLPAANGALNAAQESAKGNMESPEFTHAYLSRLLKADRLMIVCPAGPVTALAVSPDGTRLASGHADGTLAVWDRATGRQLGSVKAHERDVTHVGFALGGSLLVTVGTMPDHSSALLGWGVAKDGSPAPAAGALRALGKDVSCFAVTPDGTTVFAGGHNGLLLKRRFDESAAVVARAAAPGQPAVVAIAVSHDGTHVLTADGDTVRRWTAGLKPGEFYESSFRGDVSALAATGAGLPAIGFASGSGWLTQPVCHALPFQTGGRLHWIATNGHSIAMNGPPGRVQVNFADLATGDTGDVRAGAFSPDGKLLFTGSQDGAIRAWDVERDPHERGATSKYPITAIAVADDGRQFVIADKYHVERYEGTRGGPAGDDASGVSAVRLTERGAVRRVTLQGRVALVRDLTGNTGLERLRALLPIGRTATAAALSSDGTVLAVGDDAGGVSLWSVTDRTALGSFDTGQHHPVPRIVFSDDARYVAVPTKTGVGVWTTRSEVVTDIAADEQAVFRFVPQADRIAIAGRDGAVRVWSFVGREELTLFGHVGRVSALGVSPDGRTLVSGGATGEVKFWDARTGLELMSLRRHVVPVTVIEFAAGGKFLVTAGDGQFAVWDARE